MCGCLSDIVGLWMLHPEGIEIFGRVCGSGVRGISVSLSQSSLSYPPSVDLQPKPSSSLEDSRMLSLSSSSSSSILPRSSTVVNQGPSNADFRFGNKDLEK